MSKTGQLDLERSGSFIKIQQPKIVDFLIDKIFCGPLSLGFGGPFAVEGSSCAVTMHSADPVRRQAGPRPSTATSNAMHGSDCSLNLRKMSARSQALLDVRLGHQNRPSRSTHGEPSWSSAGPFGAAQDPCAKVRMALDFATRGLPASAALPGPVCKSRLCRVLYNRFFIILVAMKLRFAAHGRYDCR